MGGGYWAMIMHWDFYFKANMKPMEDKNKANHSQKNGLLEIKHVYSSLDLNYEINSDEKEERCLG